jgi:hypothetical protein
MTIDTTDRGSVYGVYCKLTGEQIATVRHSTNSGSCKCLSKDKCELKNKRYLAGNGEFLPKGSAGTSIINDGRPV